MGTFDYIESDAIVRPVGSADMTAWINNLPKKKTLNLYVEMSLDSEELLVQQTKVIERKKAPASNEEFNVCVLSTTAQPSKIKII
jgi:hypothetical protein